TVIDLDSETITEINFQKKQYSVMTFAEMTQAMERGMQQMKDTKNQDANLNFKVDIKQTGQSKEIAGYQAKETLLTTEMETTDPQTGQKGTMVMTSSIWIAPKVAGYEEMRQFYTKMAAKMAWPPGRSSSMAMRPDMARAMSGIAKEAAKLDGAHVLQVVKTTMMVDGQPMSAAAGSDPQTSQ